MIEMFDVSPEELNQAEFAAPAANTSKTLPRMPRKGKQPTAIPVANDDDESAPIRVHAKRPRGKKKKSTARSAPVANRFEFGESNIGEVLEKAMGVLKTGKIWIWAIVSVIVMAIGGAVWQWIQPHRIEPESVEFGQRMLSYGTGLLFGQLVFFVGYIVLLFVGGVVFRETARGKTKVTSVSASGGAEFTSTMLLFGFSMFVAALPCMFFGLMFISLPFQFFLAGIFLFAAWKNQAAFQIVSTSVFQSFSDHGNSWKNWAMGTGIAAFLGFVGGGLMEVYFPVVSVFTSFAGAMLIAFATLFYAAISGWHCGSVVEKLEAEEGATRS